MLIGLGIVASIFAARVLWDWYVFRRSGYRVYGQGRDHLVYEERDAAGTIVQVVFARDIGQFFGPQLAYVPSEAEWSAQVPVWAQARRREILGRLESRLGRSKVSFIETP